MADLSAYIDFSVQLDKPIATPASTSVIRLTDPNNYPSPVPLYMKGVFSITQPDGITITGSFATPDISWNGSALSVAQKELRLTVDDLFQNGLYIFTYVVSCVGYDDTVLTKTYDLSYSPVALNITDLFDVFTPSLTQIDSTNYLQDGFDTPTVTRAWSSTINYAGTSIGNITGTTILFDLKYSGYYWDAKYIITLTATATYTATDDNDWFSLIDRFITTYQADAYTPPTIQSLLSQLNIMKQEVDAGTYCGCGCGCSDEQAFLNAQADYNLLKNMGCNGNTVGIYYLIPEMIKLFTCNGNYSPLHTNAPLTAYNFGCGSTGTVMPPIQFTVDSGGLYVPASNQPIYDNPTLAGNNNYVIYRNSIGNYLSLGNGDFTYRSTGGFTLSNSTAEGLNFVSGEKFTLIFSS